MRTSSNHIGILPPLGLMLMAPFLGACATMRPATAVPPQEKTAVPPQEKTAVPPQEKTAVPPQEKVLRGTWAWDIDTNTDGNKESRDIWWEQATDHERYLVAQNGAGITVMKGKTFEQLTLGDLEKAVFTTDGRISGSDISPMIEVGTVLAVRTSEGSFAKLEVIGFEPHHCNCKFDMKVRYVVFKRCDTHRP